MPQKLGCFVRCEATRAVDLSEGFAAGVTVGLRGRVLLLGLLVEPPHVTSEAVLVPEHLVAVLAVDEGGLGSVHVPNMAG